MRYLIILVARQGPEMKAKWDTILDPLEWLKGQKDSNKDGEQEHSCITYQNVK